MMWVRASFVGISPACAGASRPATNAERVRAHAGVNDGVAAVGMGSLGVRRGRRVWRAGNGPVGGGGVVMAAGALDVEDCAAVGACRVRREGASTWAEMVS